MDVERKMTNSSITRIKSCTIEDSSSKFERFSIQILPQIDLMMALDDVTKDVRLDVGAQKTQHDDPMESEELCARPLDSTIIFGKFISVRDVCANHK